MGKTPRIWKDALRSPRFQNVEKAGWEFFFNITNFYFFKTFSFFQNFFYFFILLFLSYKAGKLQWRYLTTKNVGFEGQKIQDRCQIGIGMSDVNFFTTWEIKSQDTSLLSDVKTSEWKTVSREPTLSRLIKTKKIVAKRIIILKM